ATSKAASKNIYVYTNDQRTYRVCPVFSRQAFQFDESARTDVILIVNFFELASDLFFTVKNLNNRHDVNRFVNHRVHIAVSFPFNMIIFIGIFLIQYTPDNNDRNEQEHDNTRPEVDIKNNRRNTEDS